MNARVQTQEPTPTTLKRVGEHFTITLEGITGSMPLGEVEVSQTEGEEGGFELTLVIPPETQPGFYTIRATSDEGETASADLTVTEPSEEAIDQPATISEPSGEPHELTRTKAAGQIATVLVLALVSLGAGGWLVRKGN
ncbi:MAG TPA: hypothetical protein VI451_03310 [Anaerolineales bacterium]|nr:hypothetical protein [Anaerolineales bacterium]